MKLLVMVMALGLGLAGCADRPPAAWQKGGAPTTLLRARWVLGELAIEVLRDGKVMAGGETIFTVDHAGRVFDADNEPVALLMPTGKLVGLNDKDLGRVGAGGAALPGEATAWVTVAPSGEVLRHDDEGETMPFGAWVGCGPAPWTLQTCTLITHLIGPQLLARGRAYDSPFMPGTGVGVGVGVPIR